MYIKEIRLKNYRCYKSAKIKFGLDRSGKNINLCTGEIEAGKTTLFNAIGWCLYGVETQYLLRTKIEEKGEKPIPHENSYEGNKTTVEVEIDIKIPENNSIDSLSIRRVATFVKGATNSSVTDFNINAYHGGEKIRITDNSKFLNQFLPEDLIQFYLFDGEYLQHTATNSNLKIRDGLKKLFNIEKIENASELIGELIQEWFKQSSKIPKRNNQLSDIDGKMVSILEKKHANEEEIGAAEKERADLICQRDTLKEELSKSQDLQIAINRFGLLEEQEKDLEKQLKQENVDCYTEILTRAYLINGKKILQKVYDVVKTDPKIQGLPADVRTMLLHSLLESKKCVCGTHIQKGSAEEKAIKQNLHVAESEGYLDFLLDLTSKIPVILTSIQEKINSINNQFKSIQKLEEKRKDVVNEKNEVQKQLPKGKYNVNIYQAKLSKFTSLSEDINDVDKRIMTYRSAINDFEDQIDELKKERTTLSGRGKEESALNRNIKIADYLKKIFEKFNKDILNNVASELETEINSLITKIKKISKLIVKITTDNNQIDFNFVEKGSTKHYLTGGQNQLFGVIIMAAFVRIMDRRGKDKLPFVFMDNPFSSIDKGSLEIISEDLSDLFKNAQVILFTTNDKASKVYEASKSDVFTALTLINDGTNISFSDLEKNHG